MFGEPLLDKHLDEYIRYAKELGFTYTFVTTNGYLLDEEKMSSLIEAGLDSIKFSFNGGTKEHYLFAHGVDGFQRVKDNIITLSNYRERKNKTFKIYISSVLTQYTKDDGEEIRKQFEAAVDDILILECHNQGGNMNYEIENDFSADCKYRINDTRAESVTPVTSLAFDYKTALFQKFFLEACLNRVRIQCVSTLK